MNTTLLIILIVIIALLGGALAVVLLWYQFENIKSRLTELEQHMPKRHTHRTIGGLEDAKAVAIDLLFYAQAQYIRLQQLDEILDLVRKSPHSYDPDRPAGRRKEQS